MILSASTRAWLMANRTSARMAMLLRIATLALSSVSSVLWTRLLLGVLGDSVYGSFLSFQRATRLAGLGDFGLSSGLALRVGQFIGRDEPEKLRKFLASARTVQFAVAIGLGLVFCGLSPWLPSWLGFEQNAGTGPLSTLFFVGGVTISIGMLAGYFNGLNGAYATVTWPILPIFFLGQFALAGQWLVARTGAVLWVQALVPLVALALQGAMLCWMLRAAHPWLGRLRPLGRDPAVWRELLATSGWIYLYSIGNIIFTSIDALLINAGFGAAAVTPYQLNYKLVEIAIQVVASASFIGQSKINLWIHSPEKNMQDRARAAVQRLGLFQSWFGTAAALGYLAVDNLFIRFWVGEEFRAPLAWQWAFALNLAVTLGGDAGIQIAALSHRSGLRMAGIVIGLTGLLNLALSFVAMKMGSIAGIAYATVLSQSILSLVLARFTSRHLGMPFGPWLVRAWVAPVISVTLLALLQRGIGSDRWASAGGLLAAAVVLLAIQARFTGVTRAVVSQELEIVRQMLGRNQKN